MSHLAKKPTPADRSPFQAAGGSDNDDAPLINTTRTIRPGDVWLDISRAGPGRQRRVLIPMSDLLAGPEDEDKAPLSPYGVSFNRFQRKIGPPLDLDGKSISVTFAPGTNTFGNTAAVDADTFRTLIYTWIGTASADPAEDEVDDTLYLTVTETALDNNIEEAISGKLRDLSIARGIGPGPTPRPQQQGQGVKRDHSPTIRSSSMSTSVQPSDLRRQATASIIREAASLGRARSQATNSTAGSSHAPLSAGTSTPARGIIRTSASQPAAGVTPSRAPSARAISQKSASPATRPSSVRPGAGQATPFQKPRRAASSLITISSGGVDGITSPPSASSPLRSSIVDLTSEPEGGQKAVVEEKGERGDGGATVDIEPIGPASTLRENILSDVGELSDSEFEEACRFFKLDPAGDAWKKGVQLVGTNIRLTVAQTFGTVSFLRLIADGTPGGGWLADSMGMGKTILSFAVVVLVNLLAAVKSNYQRQPHAGSESARPCQMASQYGIECVCEGGLASRVVNFLPRSGLTVYITRPNLLSQTFNEAQQYLDGSRYKVYIDHGEHESKRPNRRMLGSPFTADPLPKKWRLRDPPPPVTYRPPPAAKRNIVICSYMAFEKSGKFVNEWNTRAEVAHEQYGSKAPIMRTLVIPTLVAGIVVLDEAHLYTRGNTYVLGFLKQQKGLNVAGGKALLSVFMTGTPWEKSCEDMKEPLLVLEQPSWSGPSSPLHQLSREPFASLYRRYNRLIKRLQEDEEEEQKDVDERAELCQALALALHKIMVRRTNKDVLRGVSLGYGGACEKEVIECGVPPVCYASINALAEKVKEEAYQKLAGTSGRTIDDQIENEGGKSESMVHLRLSATFPAVAALCLDEDGDRLSFRGEDVEKELQTAKDAPKSTPYWQIMGQLLAASPKADALRRILVRALRQDQERSRGQPVQKKVVIFSESPGEIFLVYLACLRWQSNDRELQAFLRPVLIHSRMPLLAREVQVGNFKLDKGSNPNVLCSTTGLIGTGTNLQRANHIVLMSPTWLVSAQTQAEARVDRKGQTLTVHKYYLIAPAHPIECRILVRHQARGRMAEDAWVVVPNRRAVAADPATTGREPKHPAAGDDNGSVEDNGGPGRSGPAPAAPMFQFDDTTAPAQESPPRAERLPLTEEGERILAATNQLFNRCFPHGWERIVTPSNGLLCGLYALRYSILEQVSQTGLPDPTVAELQQILKEIEIELQQPIPHNNLSVDLLGLVLHRWGLRHGAHLRLGYILREAKQAVRVPMDDEDELCETIWISSTSPEEMGKDTPLILNHYEGLRPLMAVGNDSIGVL
jgi:hypothetical protein